MPRRPRIFVEGGFYHLILRGNAHEALFRSDEDYRLFQKLAVEGLERYGCQLHAYCWMTNHIHSIVRVSDRPLGNYVRWLGTEYARKFNRRYQRSGHVFERRHRAILVSDDAYLLTLVRYTHMNPVDAGIVSEPVAHRWNSHRAYLQPAHRPPWLQTQFVLEVFSADMTQARRLYENFIADVSSCEQRHAMNDAIWAHDRASPMAINNPDCPPSNALLNDYFLRQPGVTPELLTRLSGPGRVRHDARLRARLASQAIHHRIATVTEVAAYFGRTRAAISHILARHDNSPPKK